MTDAEKLSLAYQLQSQNGVKYPTLSVALAQVNADAVAMMPPAPLPGDVVGLRLIKNGKGKIIEHVQILGDGSERAI